MKSGDSFMISGYELVAMAKGAQGGGPPHTEEVIVLNNNHNWFLVAGREAGSGTAYYYEGYSYNEEEQSALVAYARALTAMVHLAFSY